MFGLRYLSKCAINCATNCAKYGHSFNNSVINRIDSKFILENQLYTNYNHLTNRFLNLQNLSDVATNDNEDDDQQLKKGQKQSLKRHPSRDRREVISVETSLRYMKSKAYLKTYAHYSVWHLHRRKFKGQFSPIHPRESCIADDGFLTSGNPCPICRDKYLVLHYTNLDLLKQFIDEHTGYLYPNTYVCLCFMQYEKLCVAYTLAKEYGLISFQLPFREYNYSLYYPKHYQNKLIKS